VERRKENREPTGSIRRLRTPDRWGAIRSVQAPVACSRERYTQLISEESLTAAAVPDDLPRPTGSPEDHGKIVGLDLGTVPRPGFGG